MLSNRIHGCDYLKSKEARWFLTWCGTYADPELLRSFFSMRAPTVRAVYEALLTASGEFKDVALFTSLYNLRHDVDNDLMTLRYYFFRIAVRIGSAASQSILDIAQQTCPDPHYARDPHLTMPKELYETWIIYKAAAQADIPLMQLCIGIGARLGDRKDSLGPILWNIISMRIREDEVLVQYLNLLVQGGFFVDQPWWPGGDTGLHLCLWETQGLTIDRVIYEALPEERRRLYRLFESLHVVPKPKDQISLAGVLTFAQDGPDALKAYIQSHGRQADDRVANILEMCLSESAYIGEIRSASSLLEAGVNPNVPSLSREHHGRKALLWSPVARSAMAGNPEMLRLLLADPRLDIRSFYTLATADTPLRSPIRAHRRKFMPKPLHSNQRDNRNRRSAQYHKEDRERLETIVIIRAVAQSLSIDVDAHILNATFAYSGKGYDTGNLRLSPSCFWEGLCHFRLDGSHALLIPGLVENNVEFQIHGLDLLHLSIRNGCSLQTANHLLQRGFKIGSQPCGRSGQTMLHSALLSQSLDRSDIVDLLLQAGADHCVDGGGMTILEASLADDAGRFLRPQEYLKVFKRLFKFGAPVAFCEEHRTSPKRRSLINLLLEANAEDDLILGVVDAGVDVNDRGGGIKWRTTPLQQAIERGRLNLAAELIRRGADVSAQPGEDRYGYNYTALQKACASNAPLPFIRLLVEAGADVNEPPPVRGFGLTSLEYAAGLGLLNMTQYLLEQGAQVNSLGSAMGCDPLTWNPAGIHRTRPLDWAACDGRLDMVSFLLQSGGRSGRPGRTGLDGAIDAATVLSNHFAVAKVLRDWASKHRNRLLKDEAAWQRSNAEGTSKLLEV